MFAVLSSMKLWIHLLAIDGMPFSPRRASSESLFTPLNAPLRSKATRVTTLFFLIQVRFLLSCFVALFAAAGAASALVYS